MKRRDFVKASLCLGCAGAFGAGVAVCKKNGISPLYDIKTNLAERKFLYKSEKDLPKKIRLDLCNMCQLHCVECWIRNNEEQIKEQSCGFGYVSFQNFKNLIDNNPFLREIETSNHGEIFLNPDLEDIIRYAHEKGVKLTAYTGVNLNTLSEKMAETLVKNQFKIMVVSIDGATPEIYSIYRRGGDFNAVINNIKTINKYKKKYSSKYPVLVYKFILFGHNVHEIEKAKELAKKLDMPIWFAMNNVKTYSPLKEEDTEKILKATGLKSLDSNVENNFEKYQNSEMESFYCTDLYSKPQFAYNGDMFGCCKPFLQTYGVNLFKDGLLKTLNNEKVLYTKLMLSDFSVKPREDSLCNGCYVYDLLKENNFPIKYKPEILNF